MMMVVIFDWVISIMVLGRMSHKCWPFELLLVSVTICCNLQFYWTHRQLIGDGHDVGTATFPVYNGAYSIDGSFIFLESASLYGNTIGGYAFMASRATVTADSADVEGYQYAFYCNSESGCSFGGVNSANLGNSVTLYGQNGSQSAVNIVS
jgi:hypothetical protein